MKIDSYRDPRLYAVAIVADKLRQSQQPLVPSQLINFGGDGENGQTSMLGALLSLLTAEKLGVEIQPPKLPAETPAAVAVVPVLAATQVAAAVTKGPAAS